MTDGTDAILAAVDNGSRLMDSSWKEAPLKRVELRLSRLVAEKPCRCRSLNKAVSSCSRTSQKPSEDTVKWTNSTLRNDIIRDGRRSRNLHSHLQTQQCRHPERKRTGFLSSTFVLWKLLGRLEQLHHSDLLKAGPRRAASVDTLPSCLRNSCKL